MILSKKVLIIEDDNQLSSMIKIYMQKDGWNVDIARNGQEGLLLAMKNNYDLITLDLMLGNQKGEDICKSILSSNKIPIIVITAKSRDQDKVKLLYMGADDYITKPFSLKVFMARVYSVIRRYDLSRMQNNLISFNNGDFVIDNDTCIVTIKEHKIALTSTELKMLNVLAKKPMYVFSRNDLMFYVLNSTYSGDGRVIDSHIKNIRKKIERDPNNPEYILTVIGSGYKLVLEPDPVKPL